MTTRHDAAEFRNHSVGVGRLAAEGGDVACRRHARFNTAAASESRESCRSLLPSSFAGPFWIEATEDHHQLRGVTCTLAFVAMGQANAPFFNRHRYRAMSSPRRNRDCSLVARDFHTEAQYDQWSQYIIWPLTPRQSGLDAGRQVYVRVPGNAPSRRLTDGELIGSNRHVAVRPPSRHPSGMID